MDENVLFSRTISGPKRKYYLDLKTAKNGSKYIVISEQVIGDTPDKKERHRIMVFDEAFEEFMDAINELKAKIQ